jgi:ParB-like chromosome segregation protein Spo0J
MGTIPNTTRTNLHAFRPDDKRLIVVTDPNDPDYDKRVEIPPTRELIDSIIDSGIHQAPVAKKRGEDYIVVLGKHRVMAARIAAVEHPELDIKIIVRIMTLKPWECIRNRVIENEIRTDSTPLLKAYEAKRMLEMGADEEMISRAFGASFSTIKNWISVYDKAHENVIKAENECRISFGQAQKISRHKAEYQEAQLKKAIEKGGRQKPGPKPGPRRKKIVITAIENDDGGLSLSWKSHIPEKELIAVWHELMALFPGALRSMQEKNSTDNQ